MSRNFLSSLAAVSAASACFLSNAHATIIFADTFYSAEVGTTDVNYPLDGLNLLEGSPAPTDDPNTRQSGTAGVWFYQKDTSDPYPGGDTQLGNTTPAGQDPSNLDFLLVAFQGGITCDLPLSDQYANGGPLTISFDMAVNYSPNTQNPSDWIAFRVGQDFNRPYPVINSDIGFSFLYRINKDLQVFTTNAPSVETSPVSSNHFDVVLTDSTGKGSAFTGNGTQFMIYSGGALVGTYTTAQFTQPVYMSFKTMVAFGSVDNLQVATGLPSVTTPAVPLALTSSSFNVSAKTLALTWNSVSGKTYQITHSSTLSGTDWTAVGSTVLASGTSSSTTVSYTPGAKDFFRVEEVAVP